MKKISILFVSILTLSLLGVSCDADFEEINKNPNRPEVVPAHLLLGNIIRINQNVIYGMQQGGDMGMCWSQQVSKVQYNDEERYIPRFASIDGVWTTLYSSVLTSAQEMYKIADEEGNDNLKGISLVLQANAFQILTDLYGPIPFKEFNVPNNVKPAYDTQQEVYKGILKMLTDADLLLASNKGVVPTTSDLLYKGDAAKWRKFANSLHLKALMRISKVGGVEINVDVPAEVKKLVDAGNLMTSNSDSAQLTYLAAQPDANPIYETVVFGARAEYKLSSVLVDKLKSSNDLRLEVFGSPINAAGLFVGNVPGTENAGNYNGFSAIGKFYIDPKLPGVLLSYAQVEFYLAEAANEGFIPGGLATSEVHYKKGVEANYVFNGLTASDALALLVDPAVAFSGTPADASKKIGEQMWISLFGQGFEAWTEWRRTGFPALVPVVNAAPGVTTIPSRLFYNSQEVTFNNASYVAGVALLKGPDKLTTRLWWMK